METNGAIQTRYAGHLFRSRLEARWAVFFDEIGIKWKYEHQGYQVNGYKYLPDFFLPDSNDWCEVKGDIDGIRNDFDRMSNILGPESPIPGFARGESSLILLGDIPRVCSGDVAFHPALCMNKTREKTIRTWSAFVSLKNGYASAACFFYETNILGSLMGLEIVDDVFSDSKLGALNVECRVRKTMRSFHKINSAYEKARSARFEYGESVPA